MKMCIPGTHIYRQNIDRTYLFRALEFVQNVDASRRCQYALQCLGHSCLDRRGEGAESGKSLSHKRGANRFANLKNKKWTSPVSSCTICVRLCAFIYIYICICIHIYIHTYIYVYLYLYLYLYLHLHLSRFLYQYQYLYAYTFAAQVNLVHNDLLGASKRDLHIYIYVCLHI